MTVNSRRKGKAEELEIAALIRTIFPGGDWDYHKDLNLAMQLVPQVGGGVISRFMDCLEEVTLDPDGDRYCLGVCKAWMFYVPDKAIALCRAYILWKGGVQ